MSDFYGRRHSKIMFALNFRGEVCDYVTSKISGGLLNLDFYLFIVMEPKTAKVVT